MFNLDDLIRNNIKQLSQESSPREDYKGKVDVFLDQNENPLGSPLKENYNRYPDPMQIALKDKISHIKGVPSENIFLGNGSTETIDILFRAFCNPGKDSVILTPPTFDTYERIANINDVFVKRVPLSEKFQLDVGSISEVVTENTKLIFLCCPNNPTGNSFDREDIEMILNNFHGIVVIDEAYINFSRHRSFIPELTDYPNLVVLQTFSKAWGLAGLRLGMVFASEAIISVFNKIKQSHNINSATQHLVSDALDNIADVNANTKAIVAEREKLIAELKKIPVVQEVYPSDASFLLVKVADAKYIFDKLVGKGILVLDRSNQVLLENCLRITIGSPDENKKLLNALND
jgi:histidinol-phosphate aminotransferase